MSRLQDVVTSYVLEVIAHSMCPLSRLQDVVTSYVLEMIAHSMCPDSRMLLLVVFLK